MKVDFNENEFIEINIIDNSSVDVHWDYLLAAKLKSDSYSGCSEAWVDGNDIRGFVEELKKIRTLLKGNATLSSTEAGDFNLELKNIDTLGHFVLKFELGKTFYIHSEVCEAKASYVFQFESKFVPKICDSLINYFETEINA